MVTGPGGERGNFVGYQTVDPMEEVVGETSRQGGGWKKGLGWWPDEQSADHQFVNRTLKRLPFEFAGGVAALFADPLLAVAVGSLILLDIGQALYHQFHE